MADPYTLGPLDVVKHVSMSLFRGDGERSVLSSLGCAENVRLTELVARFCRALAESRVRGDSASSLSARYRHERNAQAEMESQLRGELAMLRSAGKRPREVEMSGYEPLPPQGRGGSYPDHRGGPEAKLEGPVRRVLDPYASARGRSFERGNDGSGPPDPYAEYSSKPYPSYQPGPGA